MTNFIPTIETEKDTYINNYTKNIKNTTYVLEIRLKSDVNDGTSNDHEKVSSRGLKPTITGGYDAPRAKIMLGLGDFNEEIEADICLEVEYFAITPSPKKDLLKFIKKKSML